MYQNVTIHGDNEEYVFDTIKKVPFVDILLIDTKLINVYPAYKVNEHRYGIGREYYNTVDDVKNNEQILHTLAHTKILDNFIPTEWLYILDIFTILTVEN